MAESLFFNKKQRFWVGEALETAEALAEGYFQVDLRDIERFPYDVRTLAHLKGGEKTHRALAQVCKYEFCRENSMERAREFYRICLQDDKILRVVETERSLRLRPLLFYVITHELIHVIRFSLEPQRFYLAWEEKGGEERFVHQKTYEILKSLGDPEIQPLLEYYQPWREKGGGPDLDRL